MPDIKEIQKAVVPIASSYGVKRLYLFGSYAKGTANEKSDIDLLVEKGKPMSLLKLSEMRQMFQEACEMFNNDYNTFMSNSVFQNACCMCILPCFYYL